MLEMQSDKYENYGTAGYTENLDDAARFFKFATKQDGDNVQNADVAKKDMGAKGNQRVNMHSHPNSNGTKDGSPKDISNAKQSPTRNAVYFKANQTLYEYNGTQSKIKEMPVGTSDDILKQMGLK